MTAEEMKRREEAMKVGGPKMAVLPTVSDFTYPATKGQTAHTVFTPYVLDHAKRTVRPPTSQNDALDQRLTWELTDIQLDRDKRLVTGNLAATSRAAARDGTKNWKHRVRAPIGDFGSLEGEINEPPSPMKTGPLRSVGYTRLD
jgi:hypothetical protein